MADYIDREFALSQVPEYFTSIDELIDVPFFLKSMPSVDAVKVVRCKDCINYGMKCCQKDKYFVSVKENDFCSSGVKKNERINK